MNARLTDLAHYVRRHSFFVRVCACVVLGALIVQQQDAMTDFYQGFLRGLTDALSAAGPR